MSVTSSTDINADIDGEIGIQVTEEGEVHITVIAYDGSEAVARFSGRCVRPLLRRLQAAQDDAIILQRRYEEEQWGE